MIAKYMGYEYTYISNRRSKEIVTSQKVKIDGSFNSEKRYYYKKVSEDDLTDIYNIEFWVTYKSGLKDVPITWILGSEAKVIVDNKIQLVFAEGILPGWDIVEKNVCSKWVELSDISEAKMVTVYKKKNGIICEPRVQEERNISNTDLVLLHSKYCRKNL